MSDEEETQIVHTEDGQMLTAEYKDGQLQIVEVTAFDKGNDGSLLSELSSDETRYVQVLDGSKGVVHLDLLSLIKCSEGEGSTYQVVGTSTEEGETTVTCVLAGDDQEEEGENQDSYVYVNTEDKEPLVYLQSSLQQIHTQQSLRNNTKKKKPLTPEEILQKAKMLQKARAFEDLHPRLNKSGRKRKCELPPPMEMLSSPSFKLYLYSCKLCSFKCNAMREMAKHKAKEHVVPRGRGGGAAGRGGSLQCARCPYRAVAHSQLMKHINEKHFTIETEEVTTNELILGDMGDADVLVCGACGFESDSANAFRKHVQTAHSVTRRLCLRRHNS